MKAFFQPKWCYAALILTMAIITGCGNLNREIRLSEAIPEVEYTKKAEMLTVFFGLDNGLPPRSRMLYKNAPGQDGMPIVFSVEIDPATLDAADFEVITQDGSTFSVEAVTLLPAEEEFELRTALLIGEYGNHPDNPPVAVNIIGDLMSRTGKNFKGQSKEVIALEEGPILSYAEYFTFTDDFPYVEQGSGCDCPKEQTQVVVKAVWSGGVRAANGDELGDNELKAFGVTLVQGTDTITVNPYQLADLDDNDNNTDLCIKEAGTPIYVKVAANTAIDPRDDLNPTTEVAVVSRW